MKQILASLLTAYVLTNGQAPPVEVAAQTTTAPAAVTNAAPVATSAATTRLATTQARVAATTSAPAAVTNAAPAVVTNAATTAAPVTTTAPVIVAATTAAPVRVTPAPVPAPTLNSLCPLNAGQQSGIQPDMFNEKRVCFTPNEVAVDYMGRLRCDNYACCQCAQINCGFDGYPCEQLLIGDNGAIGGKSINIRGAAEMSGSLQNLFGGNAFGNTGAKLECQGRQSCRAAIIRGEMIADAQCSGDYGCQDAKIVLNDPAPAMNMQCNGLHACERFDLEINVGVAELRARAPGQVCNAAFGGAIAELGKIEFNGLLAGSNSIVTIRNHGCGTLLLDSFECMSLEACPGLAVNIEGNVAIKHCDLMGVAPGNPAISGLVVACQAGQSYANWSPGQQNAFPVQPAFPQPQQPTFPQPLPPVQQPPMIPPNPSQQPPVQQPPQVNPFPANPTPSFPQPGMPMAGFGQVDPRSSSMQCDMVGMPMIGVGMANPRACAGQTITLPIANNFVLDCSLAGACNGMILTLNAGYDPTRNPLEPTTRIDSLKFIQPTSDVTIYINNEFGAMGQPVRINDVRCDGPNTCRNLKIIAGPGVDVMSTNYDCGDIMSCIGATVQQGTMTMQMDPRTSNYAGYPYQGPPVVPGGVPPNPSNPGPQVPFNPWV